MLANVYMDKFDEWLSKQWENKRTNYNYSIQWGKMSALRERSNLIPAYMVRYADDCAPRRRTKATEIVA
ncbi:hypothetical protein [Clostridium sp. DJ247]|uniref:hypothetical protein n=1 Tax=Clostridium sp. DJ247 TaxID=2726188 RepID=UPI00162A6020|nr:hypothetical protein [Clostridium sp. DJ247]MBC2580744.1 hypothetical protein [Clostridium sp. DJ247]